MRSETETRFIRLSSATQAIGLAGSSMVVGWAIIASAIILMDSIGSGNLRDQARREQALYETRLNELSAARDERAAEALSAQERFNAALDQISQMQSALLDSEDRRKELEKGIDVVQATLRRTLLERDAAREQAQDLTARLDGDGTVKGDPAAVLAARETTVDVLAQALQNIAVERDEMAETAETAAAEAEALKYQARLTAEKNDRIFAQLEDAVSISLEPMDKMFAKVGLSTDRILKTVRSGYSGQGGPLTPITFSSRGVEPDAGADRANGILERLDQLNIYRIAAQQAPLGLPVKAAFRYSSGYGPRWSRAHKGTDMAAAYGTPIYTTGDGVVTFAGTQSGYGYIVKIQHQFGIETRYAHMSKIRVKTGQRVSRGDRIGDMGSTGRSTGNHLHYEVRIGGEAVNPITYLKAANDVF